MKNIAILVMFMAMVSPVMGTGVAYTALTSTPPDCRTLAWQTWFLSS